MKTFEDAKTECLAIIQNHIDVEVKTSEHLHASGYGHHLAEAELGRKIKALRKVKADIEGLVRNDEPTLSVQQVMDSPVEGVSLAIDFSAMEKHG